MVVNLDNIYRVRYNDSATQFNIETVYVCDFASAKTHALISHMYTVLNCVAAVGPCVFRVHSFGCALFYLGGVSE